MTVKPLTPIFRLHEVVLASLWGHFGSTCFLRIDAMKVRNSLKSAKSRDKNCVVVRRKGRVYVINKRNPRFKARQG